MTASCSFAKTFLLDGGPVSESLSLSLESVDGSGLSHGQVHGAEGHELWAQPKRLCVLGLWALRPV